MGNCWNELPCTESRLTTEKQGILPSYTSHHPPPPSAPSNKFSGPLGAISRAGQGMDQRWPGRDAIVLPLSPCRATVSSLSCPMSMAPTGTRSSSQVWASSLSSRTASQIRCTWVAWTCVARMASSPTAGTMTSCKVCAFLLHVLSPTTFLLAYLKSSGGVQGSKLTSLGAETAIGLAALLKQLCLWGEEPSATPWAPEGVAPTGAPSLC